jgi:hypothetical protein
MPVKSLTNINFEDVCMIEEGTDDKDRSSATGSEQD